MLIANTYKRMTVKNRGKALGQIKQAKVNGTFNTVQYMKERLAVEKSHLSFLEGAKKYVQYEKNRGQSHPLVENQKNIVRSAENEIYQKSQLTNGKPQMPKDPSSYNKLTEQQVRVMLNGGTDLGSQEGLTNFFKEGIYCCAQCELELYDSDAKFSYCDWPSFSEEIPGRVKRQMDANGECETTCARCDAHLGHRYMHKEPIVRLLLQSGDAIDFSQSQIDLPSTGHRDCINTSSINFRPMSAEQKQRVLLVAKNSTGNTATLFKHAQRILGKENADLLSIAITEAMLHKNSNKF